MKWVSTALSGTSGIFSNAGEGAAGISKEAMIRCYQCPLHVVTSVQCSPCHRHRAVFTTASHLSVTDKDYQDKEDNNYFK